MTEESPKNKRYFDRKDRFGQCHRDGCTRPKFMTWRWQEIGGYTDLCLECSLIELNEWIKHDSDTSFLVDNNWVDEKKLTQLLKFRKKLGSKSGRSG
jgi:hypothetical protein